MNKEQGKTTYQQPKSEIIELTFGNTVLQEVSPTPGGGEGVGGGTDL